MAYTFSAEGWEDYDNNRHPEPPDDIADTYGVFVHVVNPDDPDDQHYFWAYTLRGEFEEWAEWWTYIGGLMEMHGMALA